MAMLAAHLSRTDKDLATWKRNHKKRTGQGTSKYIKDAVREKIAREKYKSRDAVLLKQIAQQLHTLSTQMDDVLSALRTRPAVITPEQSQAALEETPLQKETLDLAKACEDLGW